jgi:hypothetical protein
MVLDHLIMFKLLVSHRFLLWLKEIGIARRYLWKEEGVEAFPNPFFSRTFNSNKMQVLAQRISDSIALGVRSRIVKSGLVIFRQIRRLLEHPRRMLCSP